MTLACTAARKRMYAKASFDARDGTGQSVLRHVAPLDRSRTVRFTCAGHVQVVRTDVLPPYSAPQTLSIGPRELIQWP